MNLTERIYRDADIFHMAGRPKEAGKNHYMNLPERIGTRTLSIWPAGRRMETNMI